MRTHPARLLPFLVALAACEPKEASTSAGDSGASGPTDVEPANDHKLVEHLADAEVASPLLTEIVGGGEIRGKEALALDFERRTEKDLRWKPSRLGRIVPRPDGGKALAVRPSTRRPLAVQVPASAGTFYRVSRAIRGPRDAVELFVLEMSVAPEHDSLNHPDDLTKVLGTATQAASFVKLRALIGQRRFETPPRTDAWTSEELVFFSSRDTRSLLLVFQSLAKEGRESEPVFFDDIRVEALQPTAEQRIELVRKRYDLKTTHDGTALHAFGQFLPVPAATRAKREDEVGFAYRHGILAPPETTITWRVPVPAGATLSLGLALLKESPSGSQAICRLRAGDELLLDELVDENVRTRFREHSLDLSAFAGRTIELTLETEATEKEPGIPVVTNPVLWRPRRAEDPPNVYLIAVDTLRADRLSLYGCPRPTSPHLEALARDAVTFENVIAQSNWTPESFASLFTSQYSGRHGVTQRLSVLERNEMAHVFREAGYTVQGIAYKLLLYDMGFERGFDAYFNVPKFHLTQSYMVRAADNWSRAEPWLDANANRRTFLFYHLNDPHQPFNHEGESLTKLTPAADLESHGLSLPILITNKTVRFGGSNKCRDCTTKGSFSPWFVDLSRSLYDGEVAYTDEFVGRFVDKLRALGSYDESLIIFVADHGEGLAEHGDYIGHGFHYMHDEQIRVPLLIKPPKSFAVAGGTRVAQQVRLIDLFPTMLELLGLESERPLAGESLVGLMRGGGGKNRLAVSENVGAQAIAVRDGRYKYILHYKSGAAREALYDLENDPREQSDLFGKPGHTKTVAALRFRAADHIARTHPGRFLMFAAHEKSRVARLNLKLRGGSARLRPILGRLRGSNRGRKWRIDKEKRAPNLIVLAEVTGAPADTGWEARLHGVPGKAGRVTLPPANQWQPLAEAAPTRIGKHGVLLVGDNPRAVSGRKQSISGEQLEALEALGYVEE